MKPWKVVLISVISVFLVIITAIAALAVFIFAIPIRDGKKKYGEDKYRKIEYVENGDSDYLLYNGGKYIDQDENDKIRIYNDADLKVVISWSSGLPFASIIKYSSYDNNNPDYIVADRLSYVYTNEKFNIKNENMTSELFDTAFKITDMISGNYLDLDLYKRKRQT